MKIQDIVPSLMEPHLTPALKDYVLDNLDEFKRVLAAHPLKDHTGGVSICEAFWLYCLVRDLAPEVVVESGTLYGFSLWFLEKARGCNSELHSFDPGYAPKYLLEKVDYHRCDWRVWFPYDVPENALVFFDDHQDHGMRLEEAEELGVRDVVFHDNYLSLKHSHRPIRYCELPDNVEFCFTFPCLGNDPVFEVGQNAQTYRWLMWLRLEE